MTKHYAGELAYWDTFAGLVPCKVLEIRSNELDRLSLRVKLTATRGAYKRGEVAWVRSRAIVPRGSVRTRNHKHLIVADYEWVLENTDD